MTLLMILVCALGAYLFFCFLPAIVMFHTIFFWPRPKGGRKKAYYLPYKKQLTEARQKLEALSCREVSVTAKDGVVLKGDYYSSGNGKIALLFHGYHASPMTNCAWLGAALWERGYDVLMVYQRGHGKSGGRYVSMGPVEQDDVLCWANWAGTQPNVQTIILAGVSMGAAAVAFAADQLDPTKVRALVLDCGFVSVHRQLCDDCKKKHIPAWTVMPELSWFYRLRFDGNIRQSAEDDLARTSIPCLFLHGTGDRSVSLDQTEMAYRACRAEKEIVIVPDAEHTCALVAGGEPVMDQLFAFLDRHTTCSCVK